MVSAKVAMIVNADQAWTCVKPTTDNFRLAAINSHPTCHGNASGRVFAINC